MSSNYLRNSCRFSPNILLTQPMWEFLRIGITLSSLLQLSSGNKDCEMIRYACARLDSNEIPAHTSLPKAFSAPKAAEHVPPKSTLVCVLQWHLSTQHKQNCRPRMASRFLSPSSLALIIVFSSWYLCCGVAEFKLQSDSLYYLFSAMIYFSTSRVSGKTSTCSCPDNKAPIPIPSLSCVISTEEKYFCLRDKSTFSPISQLPASKFPQYAGVFKLNFSHAQEYRFHNTKIMLLSLESSLKEILNLPYWTLNAASSWKCFLDDSRNCRTQIIPVIMCISISAFLLKMLMIGTHWNGMVFVMA